LKNFYFGKTANSNPSFPNDWSKIDASEYVELNYDWSANDKSCSFTVPVI